MAILASIGQGPQACRGSRGQPGVDGERCGQTRSLQATSVQQPLKVPAGLGKFADPEKRGNADDGGSGPGVGVVPVAQTAGILRQRRGGRGDRCSRGRVGKEARRSAGWALRRHDSESCRRRARSTPPTSLVLDDQTPGHVGIDVDERFALGHRLNQRDGAVLSFR